MRDFPEKAKWFHIIEPIKALNRYALSSLSGNKGTLFLSLQGISASTILFMRKSFDSFICNAF